MTNSTSEVQKLSTEMRELRNAVTNITLAWSGLETDMAILLSSILGEPSGAFSSAIYFAPASSETRIKIVDAAFDTLIRSSKHYEQILAAWRTATGRVNRLKNTRNAVAHGSISTLCIRNKNYLRLTAPIFDFRRLEPALAKRQIPGLTSNDINLSVTAMGAMMAIITQFWKIAEAVRSGDEPTLLETLLQVEASLKKAAPPTNEQKKPTPDTPPRSSQV